MLTLPWEQVTAREIVFLETKNGRSRRLPLAPSMAALLATLPHARPWVFANPSTGEPYRSVAKNLERALDRAGITTGDVTFHTLRHTALSRILRTGTAITP